MPYSPPLGNAVNFVRDQAVHFPPPGNQADFHNYTEAFYLLVGSGRLPLSGAADTYSAPVALAAGEIALSGAAITGHGIGGPSAGDIVFSGVCGTEIVIPTVDAYGPINLDGAADTYVTVNSICFSQINWAGEIDVFTRPPQIDVAGFGKLPKFGGAAMTVRGVAGMAAGKLPLSGLIGGSVGRVANGSGKVAFGGAAQARHGVGAYLIGNIPWAGSAAVTIRQVFLIDGYGGLRLGGVAVAINAQAHGNSFVDSVAVLSRRPSAYVGRQ